METVTSADGTVIAFDQIGSGPPLVLVSGAACDRAVDRPLADALAATFTVLNYDRRGRGDSSGLTAENAGPEGEIEDIEILLAAAGGSAVLVGLSSGAALAAHAAAAGLPVDHLVMWEPPFRLDAAGRQAALAYNARLAGLLAEDRRGDAVQLFMETVGVPAGAIAGMRRSPHWARTESLAPTLALDAAVLGDGSIPADRFARIQAPTLVLAGGAGPDFFRLAARAAAAAVGGATYGELAGQTHDVAPDALAAAVRDFVVARVG